MTVSCGSLCRLTVSDVLSACWLGCGGGSGSDRIEELEVFLPGGLSVEGYEPLASLMEGEREKVVLEPLLSVLWRGGVALAFGSLGSRKGLRLGWAEPSRSKLWFDVDAVGDREEDDGGRKRVEFSRSSKSCVIDLTESVGESLDALCSCESSDVSPPLGLGAGPPLETLARRESDRTPATTVAEAWLLDKDDALEEL